MKKIISFSVCLFLWMVSFSQKLPQAEDKRNFIYSHIFPKLSYPSKTTEANCVETAHPACNYILNPHYTTLNYSHTDDPFNNDEVPNWLAASGSPTIFDQTFFPAFPLPPPGVSGYFFGGVGENWFPGSADYICEGVVQKIPKLVPGHTYALSFFKSSMDYFPYTGDNFPLDFLHIKFINCSDYNATFTPTDYHYPPIPANRQDVYCETQITNRDNNWQQVFIHFTAASDFNMIWIYPEENRVAGRYAGLFFSNPELIDITAIQSQVIQGTQPNCMATLPNCGPLNSVFEWEGPHGQMLSAPSGQPIQIDVTNPLNIGNWVFTLLMPNAVTTNSTCSPQGGVSGSVQLQACQDIPPCVTTLSCKPAAILNGCNYSTNGDFVPSGTYNPSNPAHVDAPFKLNLIPKWIETNGSPQITDEITSPVTTPPPGISNYAYLFSTGSGYMGNTSSSGDGIAQKIPALTAGNNYAISFFKKFVKPGVITPGQYNMDKFYVVLMRCNDFSLIRTCDNTIADFPPNSQVVYCESNMNNTAWEQVFFCFTANDSYNMIWILPKQDVNIVYNNGAGKSGVDIAGLEMINTTNFSAGQTNYPNPYPNCNITIGPTTPNCGVRNAVFNWIDALGNVFPAQPDQRLQITATQFFPQQFTLEMSVPNAVYVDLPCNNCTSCKKVKSSNTSFGGNCSFVSSVWIAPCDPNYNVFDCNQPVSPQCNLIPNNNFALLPGYPAPVNVTPFNYNIVPGWKQSHGDPRINVGAQPSPFGNDVVGLKGWAETISQNPYIYKQYGDGLLVKINPLIAGNNYLLSLFLKDPRIWPTTQWDGFKAKLIKCSYVAGSGMPTSDYLLPTYSGPYQDVLCLSERWEDWYFPAAWKQLTKCFTATDQWDAIWFYSDVMRSRTVNGEVVKSWTLFAEPELINLSNFTAGVPVNLGGGSYQIGPASPNCGVRNAQFTWTLPNGSEIPAAANQQMVVTNAPGSYRLNMKIPKIDPNWYHVETCNLNECADLSSTTLVQRGGVGFTQITQTSSNASPVAESRSTNKNQTELKPVMPGIKRIIVYNAVGQLIKSSDAREDINDVLVLNTTKHLVQAGIYFVRIIYVDNSSTIIKKYLK